MRSEYPSDEYCREVQCIECSPKREPQRDHARLCQESHKIVLPELEFGSSSVSRSDSMSSSYGSNSTGIPTPLGEEGGISTFQTFVDGLKEMYKRHQEVSNAEASGKMKRDLGVDGDFERKRQEIMVLWQSCKVSLVRRAYFYLLFKGDEADSVYNGVVLRRLLFIKDRFSQRKKTSDGGETLTLSSRLDTFFGVLYIG
ncbi:unnamed protein product [Brassica napus]|nr:unnamed protein product [Brassica napus]